MNIFTPQLVLSTTLSLSLAVCVGGIHENTVLDWFVFSTIGTLTTCLLTQTHPRYQIQKDEETELVTIPFWEVFDRNFFRYVFVLVLVGVFFQAIGLVNLLVQLLSPLLNQGWQFVMDSFTNSACITILTNLYCQSRDAFINFFN